MLHIIQAIIAKLNDFMMPAMAIWVALGIGTLIFSLIQIQRERIQLDKLAEIALQARGSDHPGKIKLRGEIVEWVDKHATLDLRRWVYTAHNTALGGGMTDASALTDAIWSHERERFSLFRFLSKNAILLGLLFTSAGLCLTLSEVAPTLQASGLESDAWMSEVQKAMSGAMGGMSAAFYSSLFGIFATLILNLLGLLTLYPFHERYLGDVDAFIQGALVPVFTAIVEKDRNDVITDVLERTEKSFNEVRLQYEQALSLHQRQGDEVAEMRRETHALAHTLSQNMGVLAEQISKLSQATGNMENFTKPIAEAIKTGLEGIEDAQHVSNQQFESLQQLVFEPFTQAIANQFSSQQADTRRVIDYIGNVSVQIEELSKQMGTSLEQMTNDFETQAKASQQATHAMVGSITRLEMVLGDSAEQQNQHLQNQTVSLQQITTDQTKLTDALKNGIESITISKEAQARQIAEIYTEHKQAVEKLYDQIGERLGDAIQAAAEQGLTDVGKHLRSGVQDAITVTHEKLTGIEQMFDGLVDTQERSSQAVLALERALRLNEADLKIDLEKRRQILDDLLIKIANTSGQRIEKVSEDGLRQLSEKLNELLANNLERQERQVADLNDVLSRKWQDLMTAATAGVA